MRKIFSLFLLLVAGFNANAQRYSIVSFNTPEGLPQSQVTSITQDKDGYLWVGTLGGLAKFNGKDFHTISTDNGILNNRVSLLTFIDDILYVGHEGGVSKIEKNKISKWSFPAKYRSSKVTDILKYKNRILVSSNGAGLFELKNGKLVHIDLSRNEKINVSGIELEIHREDDMRIRDLYENNGELLIGTRNGLLKSSDLITFRHIHELDLYSVSGITNQNDQLFITTFNSGLIKWSEQNGVEPVSGIDPLTSLRGVTVDSQNQLWIYSGNGVYRLKNGELNLQLNQSNGLPMESISSVFEDKQGNIWLGSEGKGLLRFPGEQFVYFNQNDGLVSDLVVNLNQDKNGHLWIGTFDRGVIFQAGINNYKNISFENSNTVWSSVLEIDGYNWFGTGSGLVAVKDLKPVKVYYYEDGLPGDKITALLKLSAKSFYVGGDEGISIYSEGKFKRINSSSQLVVRDFCKVHDAIYCATNKGLYLLQNRELKKIGSFEKTINSLAKDKDDNIWIGTDEGLYRWKNNQIEQITFSKMTSSNYILFLNYSGDKLYVGTNNGLFVLQEEKGVLKATNYGIGEGVVNLETNLNSSLIDKQGRVWFGTAAGLVSFMPSRGQQKYASPELLMKNLLINFQSLDLKKYSKGLDKKGLPIDLRLPFNKNNVTFELDGIALANYPGMKFQYWLEGQDDTWSPLNPNAIITYNALSAGDYVFHARCVDSRGNSSAEISYAFTIKQAFYRSWWFILLVSGVLGYLVFRFFRFRLKREREQNEKEKLEYKSRLLALEQKSLNASMNRHFIFNSLNSIQYFINTQDRLSANRFLTNFAKLIRKNLDSSDDGNLVPLSQELERLELYMSLESMRFKDRFDYKINVDPSIDPESVIIPAMMLQPFIENSIIHGILPDESKKGMITVDVSLKGEILTIDLIDNGVGIDMSMQNKSNYEGDHRSQGMEITSKRIELLQKLSDRSFELIGPRQINNPDGSINGTRVTLKFQVENLDY